MLGNSILGALRLAPYCTMQQQRGNSRSHINVINQHRFDSQVVPLIMLLLKIVCSDREGLHFSDEAVPDIEMHRTLL